MLKKVKASETKSKGRRRTVKGRITILLSISIFIMLMLSSLYMLKSTNEILADTEKRNLENLTESINSYINKELDIAENSAKTVAGSWFVQELFGTRDFEGLKELTLPMYDEVSDQFSQGQFHLPDSVSFLRLHNPESRGDSLKDFRETVNLANKEKRIVRGLEEGKHGFGFRVVVPIEYENKHIGTFEYGSNLEEKFLEGLKTLNGAEYYIYMCDGENAQFLSGTTDESNLTEESIEEKEKLIKKSESIYKKTDDKKHNVVLMPLESFSGESIGYLKIIDSRENILECERAIKIKSLIFTVLTAIIMFIVFYFYIGKEMKPLELLTENAKEIANGNFRDVHIVEREDEFGQLSKSFNMISDNLSLLMLKIKDMSHNVAATAEELSATSEEVSATTVQVASSIEGVSRLAIEQNEEVTDSRSTIDDMNSKINILYKSIDDVNSIIDKTIESTDEGSKTSSIASGKIRELKETTESTSEDIYRLKEGSTAIENIVEVIQNVVSQTNLLALNATIEAARAGKEGEGFAVVATEISKLAEEAKESSDEITALIKNIQDDINRAIESMDASVDIIDESSEAVQSFNKDFNSIQSEIGGVTNEIDDLNRTIEEVYGGTSEILDVFNLINDNTENIMNDIENITGTSEEQAAAMSEIADSTVGMANISIDLEKELSQFKLREDK